MAGQDPIELFESLGGQFSPDFDAYARGKIPIGQVRCLQCRQAPCGCVRCSCGWTNAPGVACIACSE